MAHPPEPGTDIDLHAALQSYLHYLEHYRQVSPRTLIAYAGDARQLIGWCEGRGLSQPSSLDQPTLLRFLSDLPTLSPNTIRRKVHALSGWCQHMVRQGLLPANPTEDLPLPKRKRHLPQFPAQQEVERLIGAARTRLEEAAVAMLAGMGLRRGELLSLDLDDLPPDLSEARIRGKGERDRLIPLPALTRRLLQEYVQERGTHSGPLLLNRAGGRVGPTTLRRLFARLLRRSGLQDAGYSLHSMRHAYGTLLVKAGVDLGTVRDLLGHSDISVTSIYVHSDLRSKRAAVEHLPILGNGGGDDE